MNIDKFKKLEKDLAPCPVCGSKVEFATEQAGIIYRDDVEKVVIQCTNKRCGLECSFSSVDYLRELTFSSDTASKNDSIYRRVANRWNKLKRNENKNE